MTRRPISTAVVSELVQTRLGVNEARHSGIDAFLLGE